MSESSRSGEVLFAFLLGGLVGAAAGILFAPRSGKETRKILSNMSEDIADKVKEAGEEVLEKTEEFVSHAKDKTEDMISVAKHKAQNVVADVKNKFSHS